MTSTNRFWLSSSTQSLRCVPITSLTASTLSDDLDHCLAADMDDYLAKPYRADQFRATISKETPKYGDYQQSGSGLRHGT